jgi:hypothetical protein
MTHSLRNADTRTHLRIVVISVAAATVVATTAINIRAAPLAAGIAAEGQPIVRASQERAYSQHTRPSIR